MTGPDLTGSGLDGACAKFVWEDRIFPHEYPTRVRSEGRLDKGVILTYQKPMRDLYRRLKEVGFPRPYLRDFVLPDWWEDRLAEEPANRRWVEIVLGRALGIAPSRLADPEAPLTVEGLSGPRFKRWRGTEKQKLTPSAAICHRVAEIAVSSLDDAPNLDAAALDAAELRDRILEEHPFVTLESLVEACWRSGLPVVFIESLPKGAKRLDGMALEIEGRPVVILASQRKEPSWLLFHLAHEIGHVALGHLGEGDLLDVKIGGGSEEKEETEANDFANSLVYGESGPFFSAYRLKGEIVARDARNLAVSAQVSPGSIALSYGFRMDAWGPAQKALKILEGDQDGPLTLREALGARVDLDALSEEDRHLLVQVTGLRDG